MFVIVAEEIGVCIMLLALVVVVPDTIEEAELRPCTGCTW